MRKEAVLLRLAHSWRWDLQRYRRVSQMLSVLSLLSHASLRWRSTRFILASMIAIALSLGGISNTPVNAQTCAANLDRPRIVAGLMCPELLLDYPLVPGFASIAGLAFGPDGALYYARPATRAIMRIAPDSQGVIIAPYPNPQVFAENLPEAPMGLVYVAGAWYVS